MEIVNRRACKINKFLVNSMPLQHKHFLATNNAKIIIIYNFKGEFLLTLLLTRRIYTPNINFMYNKQGKKLIYCTKRELQLMKLNEQLNSIPRKSRIKARDTACYFNICVQGSKIAIGNIDGCIELFEINEQTLKVESYNEWRTNDIIRAIILTTSGILITATHDHLITLWNTTQKSKIIEIKNSSILVDSLFEITSGNIHAFGRNIKQKGEGISHLRFWEIPADQSQIIPAQGVISTKGKGIRTYAVFRNRQEIVGISGNGLIYIFDSQNLQFIRKIGSGSTIFKLGRHFKDNSMRVFTDDYLFIQYIAGVGYLTPLVILNIHTHEIKFFAHPQGPFKFVMLL